MILKLQELEKIMKPNFLWNRSSPKKMETNESDEGSKDLARNIFVGLSDIYGFEASDVCDYLDMGYESYRHKLSCFREDYKEGKRRMMDGDNTIDDPVKKFYVKVSLCMNAIKTHTRRDQNYKLEQYLDDTTT